MLAAGSQFPNQGSNPRPQQWKHRVPTTGPPGKSLDPTLIENVDIAFIIFCINFKFYK